MTLHIGFLLSLKLYCSTSSEAFWQRCCQRLQQDVTPQRGILLLYTYHATEYTGREHEELIIHLTSSCFFSRRRASHRDGESERPCEKFVRGGISDEERPPDSKTDTRENTTNAQ